MIRIIAVLCCLWGTPLVAGELELKGAFTQGGLILGKTAPGASISLNGKEIRVSDTGEFVFGFGRDHKAEALLEVKRPDGTITKKRLKISKRQYKTERINGLPPSKVTPSEQFLKRIRRENGEIAKIRAIDTDEKWFLTGWKWPASGRISGVFGSQRVLNDIPKRPHYGLDIAAPVGTPVFSSTDGLVRLSEQDLYYTGGTVMIDHGYGLVSVYSHLSKLSVKAGQFVKQGEKIGEIGATGRASGPHLDWRLNWFKERLDPQLLLEGRAN
ncbi:M23 family metallopeptidase [Sneathiella aquimaris]|uniref:M23 family metallopeptidase n=1 Tax=Sneathiella aquimaris TaxID=2599305 RepID=UPI001C68146A|nr:M23 family metallopeptidase [Sneathiella aquimaris]